MPTISTLSSDRLKVQHVVLWQHDLCCVVKFLCPRHCRTRSSGQMGRIDLVCSIGRFLLLPRNFRNAAGKSVSNSISSTSDGLFELGSFQHNVVSLSYLPNTTYERSHCEVDQGVNNNERRCVTVCNSRLLSSPSSTSARNVPNIVESILGSIVNHLQFSCNTTTFIIVFVCQTCQTLFWILVGGKRDNQ